MSNNLLNRRVLVRDERRVGRSKFVSIRTKIGSGDEYSSEILCLYILDYH